jgi:hypothetical protein
MYENIPNGHKDYQHLLLPDLPKITQTGIFGLKTHVTSGNTGQGFPLSGHRHFRSEEGNSSIRNPCSINVANGSREKERERRRTDGEKEKTQRLSNR